MRLRLTLKTRDGEIKGNRSGSIELLTSHRSNCSATWEAQFAVPYPQSSILLGRLSGGNMRRPSNTLWNTLFSMINLSVSSYSSLGSRPYYRKSSYLVHWTQICLIGDSILLKESIVNECRFQETVIDGCGILFRMASQRPLAIGLRLRRLVVIIKGTYLAIFLLSMDASSGLPYAKTKQQ